MNGVSVTAVWKATAAEPDGTSLSTTPLHLNAGEEAVRRREEDDWVARSRCGDLDAFGRIYQRYEKMVFRYAVRLLNHADEADDVRQETFLRAYRSLDKFRGDARLRTYLFAICGNLCRDRLRHRQRHPEQGYGLIVPEEAHSSAGNGSNDPLTALQRAADAARVHTVLQRLKPDDREILLLRHTEELETDEIATVLGCTKVSVPVRLFRARQRFKTLFVSLLNEEGE